MKKSEFRIEEYDGEFRVQRLFSRTVGRGRKKKEVVKYKNVDEFGLEPFYFRGLIRKAMGPFATLQEAENMVDVIIKGKKFHYL